MPEGVDIAVSVAPPDVAALPFDADDRHLPHLPHQQLVRQIIERVVADVVVLDVDAVERHIRIRCPQPVDHRVGVAVAATPGCVWITESTSRSRIGRLRISSMLTVCEISAFVVCTPCGCGRSLLPFGSWWRFAA